MRNNYSTPHLDKGEWGGYNKFVYTARISRRKSDTFMHFPKVDTEYLAADAEYPSVCTQGQMRAQNFS